MPVNKFLMAAFLAFVMAGCGDFNKKPLPAAVVQAEKSEENTVDAEIKIPLHIDIGDVESSLNYNIIPEIESSPGVEIEVMENAFKNAGLVTVNMHPPYPAEFWLSCTIKATKNFGLQPLLVQANILREQDVIGGVSAVMGEDQVQKVSNTAETRVDAFLGLGNMPDTMLIHGELVAQLMPMGTNPEDMLAGVITASPEATTMVMSNPVRINFLKE